jgi:hypothetical protein
MAFRSASFVLNAGTWEAKVGDRPFHGYTHPY